MGQSLIICLGHLQCITDPLLLLIWTRFQWCQIAPHWRSWGLLRIVRDVFHVPGMVALSRQDTPLCVTLSYLHPLSGPLIRPLSSLTQGQLVVNWGAIQAWSTPLPEFGTLARTGRNEGPPVPR